MSAQNFNLLKISSKQIFQLHIENKQFEQNSWDADL